MKPISVHVSDEQYQTLKSLAARSGRPVAELIRNAMSLYIEKEKRLAASILELPAHESGAQLDPWSRDELVDEMVGSRSGS